MTSIEQIELSGVRSFDPNPNNRQRITFKKPLTVILGKNGAGKTTIIEALLNACTGQMPPGSGIEKSSFVYDPKVAGEGDVKAQIRLLFTGRGGKVMQVIRSFQAVRARNKTSFTTLDNIVAFQDAATGKVVSSTYRSNDVDRAIPDMLGVTPAVLEHVIFCHQEEGNWPLSTPKEVKKIFDDIFAATRYVLALDRLRENNKELRRQQKEHEATLAALSEHREQARQLLADIAAKESTLEANVERRNELVPKLEEIQAVIRDLNEVEQKAESLSREAAIIEGRIGEKKESLVRLDVGVITHTKEELLQRQENFDNKLKKLEEELVSKKDLLSQAEASVRKHEENVVSLRSVIAFREQQEQQHMKDCEQLAQVLKGVTSKFTVDENMNEESLSRIMDYVSDELREAEKEYNDLVHSIEGKVSAIEKEQSAAFRSIDADNKEKEMKEEQLRLVLKRRTEAEGALKQLEPHVTQAQLAGLQEKITELEQRAEAMEQLRKSNSDYEERRNILQKFEAQNKIVAELRQQLARHNERSCREAEMNLLRTQISEKQERVDKGLRETLIAGLEAFGHDVVESSSLTHVTMQVEKLRDKKADALRNIEAEANELDRQLVVLQQRQSQVADELKRESIELKRKRSHCISRLGSAEALDSFEAAFIKAREAHHSMSHEQSASRAMAACYSHFVEKAKADGKCPLCDHNFTDDAALNNFLDTIKVKQQTQTNTTEKDVEDAQGRVRMFEELEADVVSIRRLTARIPQIEESLSTVTEEINIKRALLEDVNGRRSGVEDQLKRVQNLMQAATDINGLASEKHFLKQQLQRREAANVEMDAASAKHAEMGENGGSGVCAPTYEQLSAQCEEANAELHRLNVLLNELHRRQNGESDQVLIGELTKRRSELCELKMKFTRQSELEWAIAQCIEEENTYVGRVADIDAKNEKATEVLKGLSAELEVLHKKREELEMSLNQGYVGQLKATAQLVSNIVPKLRDYFACRAAEQLSEARASLHDGEASCAAAVNEITSLRSAIDELLRGMEEERRMQSQLSKQIEYLEKQKAIEEDEARLSELVQVITKLKLKGVPGAEAILGRDVVEREGIARIRELIRARGGELERLGAQQDGVMEAMRQEITGLKAQLAREKFKDVEKRYRTTFLKAQTTDIAVADVEKYYRALEKAVQTYHQEKIAQINQILADLWRQTYKGSDIDTIELRSEDDVTSTTVRRSYSYRVVMKRGNGEMDMRGRCSAGQRVLASVLIRLALSEAFCCDCGILALDEPTTNLDEDNARSLAESLRMLIDNHRTVKHFQLIVITHDEHFVRALGGQALDTFYYIHKDREGAFSVIEERTFDQLFAS
uniref:DNA repair protein RAD50 n=1 Tax=Trypanosoma congolense (strain IL3000) TaxID=1068625 RepID=G0V198_TRYCI|nr:unnamed protein product [Trypanosoma congolense IL3000]